MLKDSDASFINDTDEEIDTAKLEEEDWIEHMKRSKHSSQKNEMEFSGANSSITSRKMGSGMEPWPQHRISNLQSRGKTTERWEDEINEFLRTERIEEENGKQFLQ